MGRPEQPTPNLIKPCLRQIDLFIKRRHQFPILFVETQGRFDRSSRRSFSIEHLWLLGPFASIAGVIGQSSVPETTAANALKSDLVSLVKPTFSMATATLGLAYRYSAEDHPRIAILRRALALTNLEPKWARRCRDDHPDPISMENDRERPSLPQAVRLTQKPSSHK